MRATFYACAVATRGRPDRFVRHYHGRTGLQAVGLANAPTASSEAGAKPKVVVSGLADPYELLMGPDGYLWLTEKSGLKVKRVKPDTGAASVVLDLTGTAVHSPHGKDGVLGMALHPDFGKGRRSDYVYLAYSYEGNGGNATKISRYTWADGRLNEPKDVIVGLPSGDDHQAARLRYGPDGKLYYSVGDQGANYEKHYCVPNQAQSLPTKEQVDAKDFGLYKGKILRIEVRSHVFAYGLRNPNGLAFKGRDLYVAELGPATDDELDEIDAGKNYGWPDVAGNKDDRNYAYVNWSKAEGGCAKLTFTADPAQVPVQVPQTKESAFDQNFEKPLTTYGTTVDTGYALGTTSTCPDPGSAYICWPTIAPASVEVAGDDLLVTSMKDGSVYRMDDDGEHREKLFDTINRYRDTALSADGKTLYIATDSSGITRGANGAPTTALANPGAILAVPYTS